MSKPLPPDPEGMNDKRAEWADAALCEFQRVVRGDKEDALADLLANLHHWCDRNGHDFDASLAMAKQHYAEETRAEHLFSSETWLCVHCGKTLEDDAIENTPCEGAQKP